ncbi:MAG: fibronectin type III domain-containing protein [Verrucomicrobia bacterium]|nr:fibronectin type III domain-containing protein [Verrucomicrobiota bacterium]
MKRILCAALGIAVLVIALPFSACAEPWKKFLGADVGNGNAVDVWRETSRGLFPMVTGNATNWNTIVPADLDAMLASNDWICVQDGYNYRSQADVNYFFDAIRADHGALWRSNVTQLAQAMVAGHLRNTASGHTAHWELGNEIYSTNAAGTIGAWVAAGGLPYPHPASPYNDNPTHLGKFNDRGILGYQIEYQMALALEALNGVNATSAAPYKIKILAPAATVSSVNGGWLDALLSYRIVGYEIETNAGGVFTNFARPLASSLAGQVMSNLVDIVNVHYIAGPYGTTIATAVDKWVTPGSHIQGVWHTEEGGIKAATDGRGGTAALSLLSRATDVWFSRGLTPAGGRACLYAPSSGPSGTRGTDALQWLHGFVPSDTTTLSRQPGLLTNAALALESYTLESADQTRRVLLVLPALNTTNTFTNLTMLAGGWIWTNVTGVARLWGTNAPATNTVSVARASNGASYTLTFPAATFTGVNDNVLAILLTGSGLAPITPPTNLTAAAISTSQIGLTWQDASDDETGFELQRSSNGVTFGATNILAAGVTNFTDTALTAATLYTYRVRALNTLTNSAWAAPVAVTTMSVPSLNPVAILPDGIFQLQITGAIGQTNYLLASTNLVGWTTVLTNVLTNGVFLFLDGDISNLQWRFYRVAAP